MAFGLLAIAFSNKGNGKGRPISFTQFKRGLEDGNVILGNDRYKLEVVTTEANDAAFIEAAKAELTGLGLYPLHVKKESCCGSSKR